MTASRLFQPHVEGLEGVATPDLALERLYVAAGGLLHAVGVDRLSTDVEIQAPGAGGRPDAAYALVAARYGVLLGVASAHLDPVVGGYRGGAALQSCPKPLSRQAWRLADVAGHLDEVALRCRVDDGSADGVLFQDGSLAEMTPPDEVMQACGGDPLPPGTIVLVAGLPRVAALFGVAAVTVELEDRRLGRRLRHRYAVRALGSVPAGR